jgi:hypothetical protein
MFHVKHFAAKPFARHQYWLDNASAVKWSKWMAAWNHSKSLWLDGRIVTQAARRRDNRHGGIIVRWLDRHIWIDVAGWLNHAVLSLGQRLVRVFGGLGGIFWGSNFFGNRAILSNSRRSRAEKGGRDRRKPNGGRSKFSSLVFWEHWLSLSVLENETTMLGREEGFI